MNKMWNVERREVQFEDGDTCGIAGCPIGAGQWVIALEVNGTMLVEMCWDCAMDIGAELEMVGFNASPEEGQRKLQGSPADRSSMPWRMWQTKKLIDKMAELEKP